MQLPPSELKIPLDKKQIFCRNILFQNPAIGLFLPMGLGKTAITLQALYDINPKHHVLIIAPAAIARCTWQNEIKKWNMPFRTQSLVLNKNGKKLTKKKRDEIYDSIPTAPPTVYFVSRDIISKLCERFPGPNWPFKTVIIDESSSFKSYNTQRFKHLKAIRPFIERIVLLTGSPRPKGLMDLWSQIYLLDMGKRLGKTITAYRSKFFRPGKIMNGYPVEWIPIPGAEDEIYRRIADITISMRNNNFNLPPMNYYDIDVVMNPKSYKRYKAMIKDMLLELQDGTVIEAVNGGVLTGKLLQMASGGISTITYDDNGRKQEKSEIIHTDKLEMCEKILEEADDNCLIAYYFHTDRDMLMTYLTEKGYHPVIFDGTPQMEERWNKKEYEIMLIHPASCGFGLNLQAGGSILIWYTLPNWSLEFYEQTNKRLHRPGQTRPVSIYHLLTEHTIDKRVLKVISERDLSQEKMKDAILITLKESEEEET